MEHGKVDGEIAKRSAMIYLPLSIGAALLFWLAATLIGEYPLVARLGGSVWVLLLTSIVSMPIITGWVKKRAAVSVKNH
jgi:hypothetical protein